MTTHTQRRNAQGSHIFDLFVAITQMSTSATDTTSLVMVSCGVEIESCLVMNPDSHCDKPKVGNLFGDDMVNVTLCCVHEGDRFGARSVMVWGAFLRKSVIYLLSSVTTLTVVYHDQALVPELVPFLTQIPLCHLV